MRVSKAFVSIFMVVVLLAVTAGPALAAGSIQVTINNKTKEQTRISLTGPATYSFNLTNGKNKVDVAPGKYNYSYNACGTTLTGKVNFKKAGDTLNLPKCGDESGGGGGGEIKITIKNQTGGTLTLVLSGPHSYSFSVSNGTSKVSVVPGKYTYSAYAVCGSASGTKNLKGGGNTWSWWCY